MLVTAEIGQRHDRRVRGRLWDSGPGKSFLTSVGAKHGWAKNDRGRNSYPLTKKFRNFRRLDARTMSSGNKPD